MPTARGFTLIELLVVLAITGILGVLTFANFKDFAQTQFLNKAKTNIQTLLRQAQSNATTSTLCQAQGGVSWGLQFSTDGGSVSLICGQSDAIQKTINFENIKITSVKGSACLTVLALPFKVSFSSLFGKVNFSGSDSCIASSSTITINLVNNKTNDQKSFNINEGGAIDAQ